MRIIDNYLILPKNLMGGKYFQILENEASEFLHVTSVNVNQNMLVLYHILNLKHDFPNDGVLVCRAIT